MFLISVVLSVGLTTIFAESFFPHINGGNPRFVPQQEPSTTQEYQGYAPNMPQLSMEGNQPIYPMPQQPMMQQPMPQQPMMQQPMMQQPMMQHPMMQQPTMQQSMMQGFQPPFPFNPINQQQLSLLLMSTYARLMVLTQFMNMQNRFQMYQPYQYSDPVVNNYGPTPVPLPYVQQPQVDPQNNLQNEMLQQQQQQAEAQHKVILEKRKIQREYDMEIERRKRLIKRREEEDELEIRQKEIERQLRDDKEIKSELEEAEKQILEEQQKEMEQKENDLKLRQEEELRFKKIEEEKRIQNKKKMEPNVRVTRVPRKPITPKEDTVLKP